MICSRKFHTVCVDLPEIPIKSIESPKDQSNLEAYIEENFSDWRCEDCSSSNDDEVVCINRKERYTTVSEGSEDGDEGGISPQTLPMTSSKGTEGQSEFFPEPIESENMPSSSKSENFPKRFNTVDLNCNQSKADTKCNSPCGDKKCSDGKRFQSPRARSGSNTEFVTEKLENSLRKSLNNTDSYNQSILEVAKILKKDGIEGELEAINRASVLTRRTSSVEKERASRAKSMIPLDSANVGNNSTFPNNSFMTPIRERSRKDVVGSDSESIYSEKNRQSIQELTNIIKSQGIESRAREASMSSCEHSPNESRRSSNVEEKILKHTGSTINTLFGSKGKVCEEIKRNSFDKNRLMSFDGKGSIQNGSFSTSNAEMIHTPHPNALNTASSKNSQLEKGIMPQPKEINEILNDSTESSDDMHQDDETQRKLHRKDAVPDMHALAQKYSSDFVSKDNLDTINEDANPINLDTKKPSDSFVGMHAARNDPHPESKKIPSNNALTSTHAARNSEIPFEKKAAPVNSALASMLEDRNDPHPEKKKLPANNALTSMLEARNGPSPETKKNQVNTEFSSNLEARNGSPADKKKFPANSALASMLEGRNGPYPDKKINATSNPLAAMLEARNAPSPENGKITAKNELASMLEARNGTPLVEKKANTVSNPLAAMLEARNGPPPAKKVNAAGNPLAAMLEARNGPPPKKKVNAAGNPLAAMLEARNGPPPEKKVNAAGNPLAAMLEARNTPTPVENKVNAAGNPLAAMLKARNEPPAAPKADLPEVKSEQPKSNDAGGVPLKDDPVYSKFFKMMKAGVPKGAVGIKMEQENLDPTILDMDPNMPAPKNSNDGGGSGSGVPLKDDPTYAKFFKMLKSGVPRGAVENKMMMEKLDPKVLDMDPEKPVPGSGDEGSGVPLKDDPSYAKFFKMLKSGVPRGAVENKMMMEKLDPKVLDMDPEKPLPGSGKKNDEPKGPPNLKDDPNYTQFLKMFESGTPRVQVQQKIFDAGLDPEVLDMDPALPAPDAFGWIDAKRKAPSYPAVPLKEDERFEKFFKMLKTGVPRGAVENKMRVENLDPAVLDMDPEKPLPGADSAPSNLPLKDDPKYAKFFKMLKTGVPRGAVENKMRVEDLDPAVLDKDPDKPLVAAAAAAEEASNLPLKDDPTYSKFFKMLKTGVPRGAVENKMRAEDLDPTVLDKDPDKPLVAASAAADEASNIPLKDDPKYSKFFKMLKTGVPRGAVENKMRAEDLDPAILDKDPEKPLVSADGASSPAVPLKDDPSYAKFFKMLKSGVPRGAVENKMMMEKLDPKVLDMDPEKPLPGAGKKGPVPAKEDPKYAKYFEMLKEGVARGAIRQKMAVASLIPSVLDNPDIPVPEVAPVGKNGLPGPPGRSKKGLKIKKPTEKRRKLHWVEISNTRVQKNSVWTSLEDNIKIDVSEMESLFVEKLDQKKPEKTKEKKDETAKPTKVTLLDGKRSMNTSIAIARVKMSYSDIREAITTLKDNSLTEEQLVQLLEFMPTEEEEQKLKAYVSAGSDVEMLGEAEKFMLEMTQMKNRTARVEAMIFKEQFSQKVEELNMTSSLVESACDDVKISHRLKKLLAIILKLGNELNQKSSTGFTLESLLKLNTAKAFDKKTSILHYLVMLADRMDPSLLYFKEDLKHVFPASRVQLSELHSDYSTLEKAYLVFKDVVANDPNLKPMHMLSPLSKRSPHSPNRNAMSPSQSEMKKKKLETISQRYSEVRVTMEEGDRFVKHYDMAAIIDEKTKEQEKSRKNIEAFIQKVEGELNECQRLIDKVESKFMGVIDYFGEDPEMSPQKFFTTLHSFMLAFDEACLYVERQKKIKERERKVAEKKRLEAERAARKKDMKKVDRSKPVSARETSSWKRSLKSSSAPTRLPSTEEDDAMPSVKSKPVVLPESVNAMVKEAMVSNAAPDMKSVSKEVSFKASPTTLNRKSISPRAGPERSASISPIKKRMSEAWNNFSLSSPRKEEGGKGEEASVHSQEVAEVPTTPVEQEKMREFEEEEVPEANIDYAAKAEDSPEYAEEL